MQLGLPIVLNEIAAMETAMETLANSDNAILIQFSFLLHAPLKTIIKKLNDTYNWDEMK